MASWAILELKARIEYLVSSDLVKRAMSETLTMGEVS